MWSGLTGFVVASALLGAALGAWGAGRLADRFGGSRVRVGASALFVVNAIGSGLATGPISLTYWRVVGGVGVGAASVIAPAYIAEISPPRSAAAGGRCSSSRSSSASSWPCALGLAAAAQWTSDFLISQTFPTLADIGLGVAYGLCTAFAVLSLLFVAEYVKETNGRQLEDMD
jgi:MFS family permease